VSKVSPTYPNLKSDKNRWFFADGAKDLDIFTPETRTEFRFGVLGTAPLQGAGQANKEFVSVFKDRFGRSPENTSYVSHSYDAMWLLMLSAAWASRGGEINGAAMGEAFSNFSAAGVLPVQLISNKWVELSGKMLAGQGINVEGASGSLEFNLTIGSPDNVNYEVWKGTPDGGISNNGEISP
jgi:hypothetical protein